ncbi:MAG: peptide ABC transporter substrate-binding protein [Candidatus Eremiobacteraeota bacterium]|nr:peptide ABC transporter substrate-binding protein [Candidatus Eremiobacteraeota bacterium]
MKRLTVILLTAALLAGCTKVGTQNPSSSGGRLNSYTQPHVLRYATAEDLVGLNPMLNQQGTLSYMSSLTMAWLIKWDAANQPVPELATEVPARANGGISADGKTITYHLHKGVVWSDGKPFDADDVVFTEQAVLNPANNAVSRGGWDLITKLDEPDKYTVVFHLKKPYSSALVTFFSTAGGNPSILPKHILGGLPNINKAPYNSLPVGIGPFKYQSWKRGDAVTLVPDPKYFRGQPKLKKVIFKLIPSRDTVMSELQSGELDLWYPVPGSYYARLKDMGPGVTALRQPSYLFNHLDFNLTSPRVKDKVVREALRYALDRKTIREKIYHGVGIVQESPLSPSAPYATKGIADVPFDIAKANQTLDQAGWARGPDGVRQKDGVKLNLSFVTSTGSQDADQMIELIRGNWKQIGVSLDVHHYLSSLLFDTFQNGGIIYAGKFDVVAFSWQLDPVGDLAILYACNQIPPAGQNDARWCNQSASDAMTKAQGFYEVKERQPYEDQAVKALVADVPTIVLKVNEDIYIYNKDLKNFHPNQVSQFDDFMKVDI